MYIMMMMTMSKVIEVGEVLDFLNVRFRGVIRPSGGDFKVDFSRLSSLSLLRATSSLKK